MWHLFDANSYVRAHFEIGKTARVLYEEIAAMTGTVFFVWDGPGALKARRDIFPGYKMKRGPVREQVYDHFDLVASLLEHSRAIQVKVPGYEADDVIATLAQSTDEPVKIYTKDRDLLQLANNRVRLSVDAKPTVPVEDLRYYKTLVGDPSDNIPGLPGFGDKAWEAAPRAEVRAWVDAQFPGIPDWIPKRAMDWLTEDANLELLHVYWKIVGFIPVPEDLIVEHFRIGDGDRNKMKEKCYAAAYA